MLFLLYLVLAGYIVFAATATLLLWYEAVNDEHPPFERPSPSLFRVVRGYIIALGGYFTASCLVPAGWFLSRKPSPLRAERNLAHPPVIMVHGIHDSPGVWLYLIRRLEKKDRRVTTFGYNSLSSSLDEIISRLDDHIHLVEAAFPNQRPILVAHSLGGLLARKWMAGEGNTTRAAGLITLGTPHRGSKLAAVFSFGLGKHLAPRSNFIHGLIALEATPPAIPCVSLVSPTDEAVQPASSLVPPQGWNMRPTPAVSHFGMLVCPRTAKILEEELDALVTAPPVEAQDTSGGQAA